MSNDCWAHVAWRQPRRVGSSRTICELPSWWWCTGVPLRQAAVPHCHLSSPRLWVPSTPALLGTAGSCSLPPAAWLPSSIKSPAASLEGPCRTDGCHLGARFYLSPLFCLRVAGTQGCRWPAGAQSSAKRCFISCLLRETVTAMSLETCSRCHSLSLRKQNFFWTLEAWFSTCAWVGCACHPSGKRQPSSVSPPDQSTRMFLSEKRSQSSIRSLSAGMQLRKGPVPAFSMDVCKH